MAGHNKWSKVKHIKAAADAKKGRVFSKFAREITMAAKLGGGDPDSNPRLRTALAGARAQNMPNENIERAIRKGLGELGGTAMEEITYEGYGPGGVAMLVECVTDNRNRTSAEVRAAFNKHNGSMGTAGCVAHLFRRVGLIRVPASAANADEIMELALEAGAEDVTSDDEEHTLITLPENLYSTAGVLREKGVPTTTIQLDYQPSTTVALTDGDLARQVVRLHDALDDLDDTQNVYANFEIPDEVMSALEV